MKYLKVLEEIVCKNETQQPYNSDLYKGKKSGLYTVIDFYGMKQLCLWQNNTIFSFPYPDYAEIETIESKLEQTQTNCIDSTTFLKALAIAQNPELATTII